MKLQSKIITAFPPNCSLPSLPPSCTTIDIHPWSFIFYISTCCSITTSALLVHYNYLWSPPILKISTSACCHFHPHYFTTGIQQKIQHHLRNFHCCTVFQQQQKYKTPNQRKKSNIFPTKTTITS